MRDDRLVNDEEAELHDWLNRRILLSWSDDFRAVGRMVDGRIVGAFGYNNHNGASCQMHAALDFPWSLNRGLLWKAFQVPFVEWGYKVLLAPIASSNEESIRLAAGLGFKCYVNLVEAHPDGVLHLMGMRRDECKWLNIRYRGSNG